MEVSRLRNLVESFGKLKIAVVGDLILDKYVFGRVNRISPEAPVPILNVEREEYRAGGAANVALNLKAIGVGEVALLGRIGADSEGERLKQILTDEGIASYLIESGGVPTTLKTRLIGRAQQLLRVDRESKKALEEGESKSLIAFLGEFKPNAVILSDYAKGVVNPALTEGLRKLNIPVFVDPRPKNTLLYTGFTCVTPNLKEFEGMTTLLGIKGKNFEEKAQRLRERLNLKRLVVTLSERGIALIEPSGVKYFPATAREVYDVTGAGDTVVATLCAGVSAGGDWESACELANIAAGIVVGKLGTAVPTLEEIFNHLKQGL
ncbi:MAG TPA: D-glycero-beta-D-manno-heptose-7-phosphate kinase [Aquifex aeolicus]|uniref:D-glycero-beta-D-manno-heptose-7-phosphate kinase n=1 Tax=Aquifex aeolicus TaxID=63363 RepID=A0A9D0YQQ7_AQUAO|nr:D-glycero-beta-D-manno-heptose-7-phosphate kinase [Aquificales bacterium]HIP98420.1 D-glycero-beta-D-manno-heptose-7-phosphate kinase [Aquifex aeolicus]HIQ26417.1 D-glycero-beta-D-manno-heptose-7-phosphate kinase [Aquifex aeolicus]